MTTKRHGSLKRRIGMLATAAMLASAAAVGISVTTAAAGEQIVICAKNGSATIRNPDRFADPANQPATSAVPFLGFVQAGSEAACLGAVPRFGDPTPIRLTAGVAYDLVLVNDTARKINLSAAGLMGTPDLIGTNDTTPAGDGTWATTTYADVTPSVPGTYVLESSLDPRHTLLGLHAVIVVDPPVGSLLAESANDTPVSAYDQEEIMVIHEADRDFMANPDGFNMLDYDPDLHLLNGQLHTQNWAIPAIQADPGANLLVRYVNVSSINSSLGVLGLRQSVVAFDGEIQTGAPGDSSETPFDWNNVFLSAGQTADVILEMGAAGEKYTLLNRNLRNTAVNNNGAQLVQIIVGPGGIDPALATVYFSMNRSALSIGETVGTAATVNDEDVLAWDPGGNTLTVVFDGSDYGLGASDLDAVDVDGNKVYFSLRADLAKPAGAEWSGVVGTPGGTGANPIADALQEQDVFLWNGSTFSVFFDASANGMDDARAAHDINGVDVLATGAMMFTTNGTLRVDQYPHNPGFNPIMVAVNDDVIIWVPGISGSSHYEYVLDTSDIIANTNLNAVEWTGTDLLFAEAAGASLGDNNTLWGCIGLSTGPDMNHLCAGLEAQWDPNVDIVNGVGDLWYHADLITQVDGYSLG